MIFNSVLDSERDGECISFSYDMCVCVCFFLSVNKFSTRYPATIFKCLQVFREKISGLVGEIGRREPSFKHLLNMFVVFLMVWGKSGKIYGNSGFFNFVFYCCYIK